MVGIWQQRESALEIQKAGTGLVEQERWEVKAPQDEQCEVWAKLKEEMQVQTLWQTSK